jgi:hypothetical protein
VSAPRTLAGEPLELVVPGDLAERWAVVLEHDECEGRAALKALVYAAALGTCWPLLRRTIKWDPDARRFGAKVQNLLLKSQKGPCTIQEIWRIGVEAYGLISTDLPGNERDVKAAEDFSAGSGASEPPSPRAPTTPTDAPESAEPSSSATSPGSSST